MLKFTQGDTAVLNLTAKTSASIPFDLTGATLTSYIKGPNGDTVSFPNGQHTIDPDQVTNKGKYTLALTSDNTLSVGEGDNKAVITKVVQSGNTLYFHGTGILTVLANTPLQ